MTGAFVAVLLELFSRIYREAYHGGMKKTVVFCSLEYTFVQVATSL